MFEVSVEGMTTREVREGLAEAYVGFNHGALEFLEWVREASKTFVHEADDCEDFGRWLAQRCRISTFRANRIVNAAQKLAHLPRTELTFAAGEMSLDQLLEFTRYATPENELEELRWALDHSVSTLRRRADESTRPHRDDVTAAEHNRSIRFWDINAATRGFDGQMPRDLALRFERELDLYAEELRRSDEDDSLGGEENRDGEQRRVDALTRLVLGARSNSEPDRPHFVIYADYEQLVSGEGCCTTGGGEPLDLDPVRMLLCDSRAEIAVRGADGRVIDVGTPQRFVTPWLRRQLDKRDNFTCTFPNCGARSHLIAHHVTPWPEGATVLGNLVLVCSVHHRLIHMLEWMVAIEDDGAIRWFRPDGSPYVPGLGPPPALDGDDEEEWWNEFEGVPDWALPDHVRRERDEIPDGGLQVQPALAGPRGP